MRIAFVSTEARSGGATRAMARSMRAMADAGHEVVLVTLSEGETAFETVRLEDQTPENRSRVVGVAHYFYNGRYVDRNRAEVSNTPFWIPAVGLDLAEVVGRLGVDVVNVHWSSYFLSLKSLDRLMALPTPVVFTLHDMAHFTGGCHYSAGCRGFETDCRPCPQLRQDLLAVPRSVRRSRARVYAEGQPWAIAPSRWMADLARDSGLFADGRVSHVPNVLDTDRFSAGSRKAARKLFGLRPGAQVLLFGAVDNREHRKGYDLMAAALHQVVAESEAPVIALSIGAHPPALDIPGLEIVQTGYVEDDQRLAAAYQAADVTVIASREDNLPNVMLESLACGTPVAAFAVGGLAETIEDGVNGALAAQGDPAALAAAVSRVLSADGPEMRRAARRSGERFGNAAGHAAGYVAVFEAARLAAGFAVAHGSSSWPGAPRQPSPQYRPGLVEFFGGWPAEVLIRARAALR